MNHIGLVLEGGAMRGLFTVGVLDVLMEHDIWVSAAAGVSAGAAFGCNYKSRQIGRALRYNLRYCRDKRYCSLRSLIKTGDLFGAEFCYKTLPFELDPFDCLTFDTSPADFWVVCTDVLTGKPVYHRIDRVDGDCMDWIRASASMPMVSRPVSVGGYTLLDGGMSDAIPLRFMNRLGYRKNIVVLTRPRDYIKAKEAVLPLKLFLGRYPAMIRTMRERHAMYRWERDYVFAEEAAGRAFVLCPDEAPDISRTEHDPVRIWTVYQQGRKVAQKNLTALREFMKRTDTI